MATTYERSIQKPIELWCVSGTTLGFSLRFWADLNKTTRKNMTGATTRLVVRRKHEDPVAFFDSNTVPNSCYFSNALNGDAAVRLEAITTKLLPPGSLVYDIFVTLNGTTERVMYGTFTVNPRVNP